MVVSGGNIDTTQLGRVMERGKSRGYFWFIIHLNVIGMAWDNRLVRFKVSGGKV